MSVDIKLGCLTLHLEDSNWLKGLVDDIKSNVLRKLGGDAIANSGTPGLPVSNGQHLIQAAAGIQLEPQEEDKKEDEEGKVQHVAPPINLGKRVLFKIMGPQRRQIQEDSDQELKQQLGSNY